ncbi:MAG: hypothetical protein JSU94_18975 [Phycisphaerales bacterium]|nr:MAG: hypothetical protein JSU94_18975 [Phycisphaerales bacterium]
MRPGLRFLSAELMEQYEPPEVLSAEQRRDLEGAMSGAAGDFKVGF